MGDVDLSNSSTKYFTAFCENDGISANRGFSTSLIGYVLITWIQVRDIISKPKARDYVITLNGAEILEL